MSQTEQFLPLPSWRQLYAAQTGSDFFIKWLLCAAWSILLRSAVYASLLNFGSSINLAPFGILLWGIDRFPQAWVLFGRNWRIGIWILVVWAVESCSRFLVGTGNWLWPQTVLLTAAVQMLLLYGIRSKSRFWLLASIVGGLVDFAIFWNTPVHFHVWKVMNSVGIPLPWGYASLMNGVAFTQEAVLGAALAWRMAPCKKDG